jgi:hypothetical protein
VAYRRANEGVHIPSANNWKSETGTNYDPRGECNMAPKANLLPSAMRVCLLLLRTEASYFMPVCHSTVQSVGSKHFFLVLWNSEVL